MARIRPTWRVIVTLLLLLGAAAVGLGMTGPNASERPTVQVSPYDPMPRW
jgi:hypothetical protein